MADQQAPFNWIMPNSWILIETLLSQGSSRLGAELRGLEPDSAPQEELPSAQQLLKMWSLHVDTYRWI